jgi:hypothetical protein
MFVSQKYRKVLKNFLDDIAPDTTSVLKIAQRKNAFAENLAINRDIFYSSLYLNITNNKRLKIASVPINREKSC